MLTQIIANFLRLRSRHLREGVLDVFRQLGWDFVGDGADVLARKVVHSKDAITREDLIETLLVLAQKSPEHHVYAELKDKITALAPSFDPQALLAHVRRATLELSVERPDLAAAVIRATALARSPLAPLASEVFGVFDSTMDRVSANFTTQSRKLVAAIGIAVALALPLDTFDLLKRLGRSDSAREKAVALAQTFVGNQLAVDPSGSSAGSKSIGPGWQSLPCCSLWADHSGLPYSKICFGCARRPQVRSPRTARSGRRHSAIRRHPQAESAASYERHPQALLAQKLHARAAWRVMSDRHCDSHFGGNAGLRRCLVQ